MGRRPPRRRLTLRAWSGALLLTIAGCTAAPVPAGTLADRLNASVRTGEAAFASNFSTDSTAGTEWYAVLKDAAPTFRQPDGQSLVVTAAMPGDRRPATWTLHLELDGATGRIRAVAPTPDRPIWALGRVDVTAAGHGTLLSSGLDASARRAWAERIDRAAAAVARTAPPGEDGWAGGLVVEVPATGSDFQAITDELPNTASALTTCGTGTPRIVVNPLILEQPDEWLDSTLVHEAVHVATDSACVPAGESLGWAVEGLAESVTARNDPATATRNHGLVLDYLRGHAMPTALPTQLEDLTSYALAQLAVDQVRAHLGTKADDLLARATHEAGTLTRVELGKVTDLYTAELRRLAASG
ncbi:MAG TPA: hypothetical protein VGK53_22505 [Propionicimonas sp.]